MDGSLKISSVIALLTGFFVLIASNFVENTISEALFSIIESMSTLASQYDTVTGALISFIPAILSACGSFVGAEWLLNKQ